jgi:hypothetical protein
MSQQKVVLDEDTLRIGRYFKKTAKLSDIKDITYICSWGTRSFRLMLEKGWMSFGVWSDVLAVEEVMREVSRRTNLPIYLQRSLNPLHASVWYEPKK